MKKITIFSQLFFISSLTLFLYLIIITFNILQNQPSNFEITFGIPLIIMMTIAGIVGLNEIKKWYKRNDFLNKIIHKWYMDTPYGKSQTNLILKLAKENKVLKSKLMTVELEKLDFENSLTPLIGMKSNLDAGFIYIIRREDGIYKIGKSRHPQFRIDQHEKDYNKEFKPVALFCVTDMTNFEKIALDITKEFYFQEENRKELRDIPDKELKIFIRKFTNISKHGMDEVTRISQEVTYWDLWKYP